MHQPIRLLFGLVFVVDMTSAVAQQFDLLTFNCLVGYENDDHPQICAEVDPVSKNDVAAARRKWLERNGKALGELQVACRTRLIRVYGDKHAIDEAKEQARRLRAKMRSSLLADPNRRNMVNCRAYAEDFATGNPKIDIQRQFIDETLNSPAHRIEWPNNPVESNK